MSVLDELVAGALEDQRTRELTVSLEDVKKADSMAEIPRAMREFLFFMTCFS